MKKSINFLILLALSSPFSQKLIADDSSSCCISFKDFLSTIKDKIKSLPSEQLNSMKQWIQAGGQFGAISQVSNCLKDMGYKLGSYFPWKSGTNFDLYQLIPESFGMYYLYTYLSTLQVLDPVFNIVSKILPASGSYLKAACGDMALNQYVKLSYDSSTKKWSASIQSMSPGVLSLISAVVNNANGFAKTTQIKMDAISLCYSKYYSDATNYTGNTGLIDCVNKEYAILVKDNTAYQKNNNDSNIPSNIKIILNNLDQDLALISTETKAGACCSSGVSTKCKGNNFGGEDVDKGWNN